jgi:7-cyano-7-deazaguanine synthase
MSGEKVVVICSGGLDSTTLVYELYDAGYFVHMVGFNYGQRHKKELAYAQCTADSLGLRFDIVDLTTLTTFLAESGSSLVADTDVPEGHYAEDNMKKTVVPNRNMIMLSIAGGIAVATGAEAVYTGVHSGDHAIYPDCRPEFIDVVSTALQRGNDGFGSLKRPALPVQLEG